MPIFTTTCADCGTPVRTPDPDPASLPNHGCAERQRRRMRRELEARLRADVVAALRRVAEESVAFGAIVRHDQITCRNPDEAAERTGRTFNYQVHQALMELDRRD